MRSQVKKAKQQKDLKFFGGFIFPVIRKKYGDLVEFEARLANVELPEHPYWEESIEYRNAYEELENLKRRQQRKTSST